MQNGDDFGFGGYDRENCGLMLGGKKRKMGISLAGERGLER